jgi:hypothetical protein
MTTDLVAAASAPFAAGSAPASQSHVGPPCLVSATPRAIASPARRRVTSVAVRALDHVDRQRERGREGGWTPASVATTDARDSTAVRGTGTGGGVAREVGKARAGGPAHLRVPASVRAICGEMSSRRRSPRQGYWAELNPAQGVSAGRFSGRQQKTPSRTSGITGQALNWSVACLLGNC